MTNTLPYSMLTGTLIDAGGFDSPKRRRRPRARAASGREFCAPSGLTSSSLCLSSLCLSLTLLLSFAPSRLKMAEHKGYCFIYPESQESCLQELKALEQSNMTLMRENATVKYEKDVLSRGSAKQVVVNIAVSL